MLRAQEWLRNNTQSVDFLIDNIIGQNIKSPSELPLLNMLETVWPLSSQKFQYSPYVMLVDGLNSRDASVHIAYEIAKFLHKKNIPLNNQKTGYCEALQELIRRIQIAIRYILAVRVIDPEDRKMFQDCTILYKCLKDLGACLDPKYQEEAKRLGLE